LTEKERHIELAYIEKAKENKKFFGFLYEKYFEQIYLFIFKKIQEEDTTGDICSRTFLKAMTKLNTYEDRGFPFSSWLYRIASNEVNQHFRKTKKQLIVEVDENSLRSLVSELATDDKESQLQLVLTELEKLSLEKSQLIELRYFEGRSFKEIASIFALSEANAKMKVYRIIETLKKALGEAKKK
jgi:RNA polymerase sigma-70 factor (ECF subfamily)